MSDDCFYVFSPAPALPGMTPEEYVRELNLGDFNAYAPENADPRVAALYEKRSVSAPRASDQAEFRPSAVGIAGAGLMGVSIAAAFLGANVKVSLYDSYASALESAKERLIVEYAAQRSRQGLALDDRGAEREFVAGQVEKLARTIDSVEALARLPVVVESIPEKLRLKAKFYRELAKHADAPILLLTNSSSLRVNDLADALESEPGANVSRTRFASFHFFHPVARRNLVEIAPCKETAQETLDAVAALGRLVRKIPIVVGDGPGLLVNRLLQAYLNESLKALDYGVEPSRLESVCRRIGMEGAPLRVVDEIGVDVTLHSGWSFLKAFPDRTHNSAALASLMRQGKLGRKTQEGFYRYGSSLSWADDAQLVYSAAPENRSYADLTDEELALKILDSILEEAKLILDANIVRTYREIDAGLVLALGFPASKGGVCYWGLATRRLA